MAFNRPCAESEREHVLHEASPNLTLSSTDATCARPDSALLFVDWAVTVSERRGIVVYREAVLCGRLNPFR